jgi:multidrug efflux pump subunit AcrA (membrane-fusion protein)
MADLSKALLHLARTKLKAPFAGRVGEEKVDIGQYVSPGQTLGSLYSTEAAEIVVPLEGGDLFWFDVPAFTSKDGRGAPAVVKIEKAAIIPRGALHQGKVVWVVDKASRLRFRKVEVARVQGDEVIVTKGLEDGETVVTTRLKTVTDGMTVRMVSKPSAAK